MIITFLLAMILILVLMVALLFLSVGGTFFTIIAADLIVAVFIIWYVFFKRKHKKGSE